MIGDYFGQTQAEDPVSVTGSTDSSVLLYGNPARLKVCFFNHSSAAMFLKLGDGATTGSFTVKLGSGSYYETPLPIHTGSITATWDAAAGYVMVTEFNKT